MREIDVQLRKQNIIVALVETELVKHIFSEIPKIHRYISIKIKISIVFQLKFIYILIKIKYHIQNSTVFQFKLLHCNFN